MKYQKRDLEKMSQRRKASKEARDTAKEAKEKSKVIKEKRTSALTKIMNWSDRTVDGTLNVAGKVIKGPFLLTVFLAFWPAGKVASFIGDVMWNGSFKRFRQIWRGDEALKPANDNKAGENKKAA